MAEEAPPPKPKRRKRAAPAALLPITAKVTLRGQRSAIELGCMSMRQSGGFWVFVAPTDGGQVEVTRIAIDQVAMIVTRQWPSPELFQDPPREAQEARGVTPLNGRGNGPVISDPRLQPAPMPPQGADAVPRLGSFSVFPPGGMGAPVVAS